MRALVVNAGSSSLKYQVIDTSTREPLFRGQVERIGTDDITHSSALKEMLIQLEQANIHTDSIDVVGHRVVHGGSRFTSATVLTEDVVAEIKQLIPLAPLHNPANVTVIRELMSLLPNISHVAVFDTAFHQTMPPAAYTYALDAEIAAKYGIRRYGFHGTSHKYVTSEVAKLLGISINQVSLIICHIGNGASIAAIQNGKSVDTSMGMTPLEGLVMGTRTGDVDAGVLFHLARQAGYSIDQLDELVNQHGGLFGLAGNQDMRQIRELAASGNAAALLARDVYAYRIRKYIGAYLSLLPQLNAVVFTAGVGENDADLREKVIAPLAHLGLALDGEKNQEQLGIARDISARHSAIKTLVIPTNEELEIALESALLVGGTHE